MAGAESPADAERRGGTVIVVDTVDEAGATFALSPAEGGGVVVAALAPEVAVAAPSELLDPPEQASSCAQLSTTHRPNKSRREASTAAGARSCLRRVVS